MSELFRKEAVDFFKEKHLGEVVELRSITISFLTVMTVAIAVVLVIFICWGQYTRKAHVEGYLVPNKGLIKIYASQTGILTEQFVEEGQKVKQGDRLFVLSTDHSSLEKTQAQAAVIEQIKQRRNSLEVEIKKQLRIDQMAEHGVTAQLATKKSELSEIDHEIRSQIKLVANMSRMAKRYKELVQSKFVADVEVDEKEDALLTQEVKLWNLKRTRLSLLGTVTTLELDRTKFGLEAENSLAVMRRQLFELEQQLTEYESRRNIVITASKEGVVSTIRVKSGQTVTSTQPLLSILPSGANLEAVLLIPSRAIGFIKHDQTVSIHYQAFPHQRYGSHRGYIGKISQTLITPQESTLPVTLEEPVYLAVVTLDSQLVKAYGKDIALQSGMLLDADVLLDRQRLIRWIFDPILSVKGRV